MKLLKGSFSEVMKYANIIFLFLFSVHLFNFPDKFILIWCVFAIGFFFLQNKKLCLDEIFFVLAVAVVLNGLGTYYYLGENLNYSWGDIIKLTIPVIMVYPFMKQAVYNKESVYVEKIILAIVLGTFVYSMLNYYSFLIHGFTEKGRIWSEFWTDYPMNATHHSYWGCFIAGMSGYVIYCFSEKKWFRGIIFAGLIIMENIAQAAADNRMVLCVTLVAFVVGLFLYLVFNPKNKKTIKKVSFILLAVMAVVVIIFALNVGGIRTSGYFYRFMTRDGGILKNIRFQMIYEAIMKIPSHWKGGATMYAAGVYWVHNYWLQVANVSGVIPFALWMVVNVAAVIDTVKLMKSPYVSMNIKYMLIPMLASIVGYLMMEPGGTESNRYIIFYVLLIALLKQLTLNKKDIGVKNV